MVVIFLAVAWDQHVFKQMTPAQHLTEARNASHADRRSVQMGWRHILAIPPTAPEAASANGVREQLTTLVLLC